jgi:hypothetical protein
MFKHELGTRVRDKVTGVTGVITGRTEWLYGCIRYTVQPTELKDGRPVEAVGLDEDAMEPLTEGIPGTVKPTGGPRDEPTARREATR